MAYHLQTQQQSAPPYQQQQRVANASSKMMTSETPRVSIGVNLRVTGHSQQGGRKYMEDFLAVAYQQTNDEKDLEYAFFGIFDGHGGAEAAAFAKEHLMENIIKDARFWILDDDDEVLASIRDGFVETHQAMWRNHDKWPKTASGLPSTAGTTASVAFIRRGKIYVGHVGDSGITLGYDAAPGGGGEWQARPLTTDHKPENVDEMARIERAGGKVVAKMGVPRVVWNRPRIGHKGPVRRSTTIDEIPFLAVARSLGDLWSYNNELDVFVVSPQPDVAVVPIDTATFRCLIFGTDGLYNMLNAQQAVRIVQEAEKRNEAAALRAVNPIWINPSKTLVDRALARWCTTKMRADNTSVITLMLDPPGPPKAQLLRCQRLGHQTQTTTTTTVELLQTQEEVVEEEKEPESSTTSISEVVEEESSDIQINEVTSSSPLMVPVPETTNQDEDEKQEVKQRKKSKRAVNFIHRKFYLRSSTTTELSDSRVLRERRNGQQQQQQKGGVTKKTRAGKGAEKRRVLTALIFRTTTTKPKKPKENNDVKLTPSTSSAAAVPERRSERINEVSGREMRKSTLDQQQKGVGGLLKAKLRAKVAAGAKLKRHAKGLRLKAF